MERDSNVSDTSPEMERMVAERYQQMTPEQRMKIAASMFETARTIVESSLPPTLTSRERRLAFARRMYGDELPEAALLAFADWIDRAPGHVVTPSAERCESLSPEHLERVIVSLRHDLVEA